MIIDKDLSSTINADTVFRMFTPSFLDENFCRNWLIGMLHPDGLYCPACGGTVSKQRQVSILGGNRTTCHLCGKQFGILTGTVFSGLRSDYRTIIFVLFMISSGFSVNDIMVKTGLSRTTVLRYKKIFE